MSYRCLGLVLAVVVSVTGNGCDEGFSTRPEEKASPQSGFAPFVGTWIDTLGSKLTIDATGKVVGGLMLEDRNGRQNLAIGSVKKSQLRPAGNNKICQLVLRIYDGSRAQVGLAVEHLNPEDLILTFTLLEPGMLGLSGKAPSQSFQRKLTRS